jgi:hypothetical protein
LHNTIQSTYLCTVLEKQQPNQQKSTYHPSLNLFVMKAIIFSFALILMSSAAFAFGRPHNVFATQKAITERGMSQSKKKIEAPQSLLNNVTQKAQATASEARQTVSAIGRVVDFVLRIIE